MPAKTIEFEEQLIFEISDEELEQGNQCQGGVFSTHIYGPC